MRAKILFVVEGPHDEAFIGRLLRLQHGLEPCRLRTNVDPFWERTIPKSFPYNDDLRMRMPVPYFYQNNDVTLAIIVAVGESQLANVVRDTLDVLPDDVDALGVFLDADEGKSPARRFSSLIEAMQEVPTLQFGSTPGAVAGAPIRCGIYVFPDNVSQGTLENLLEECAQVSYPAALEAARGFVGSMEEGMFEARELKDFKKPSGRRKAAISSLASILRPGKAIQVSISDNRWLTTETLRISNLSSVALFVSALVKPAGPQ